MKQQEVFALVSLGSIAPSSFLLSVGIASAQPTRSDTSELTLAQALSTQERKNCNCALNDEFKRKPKQKLVAP